MTSVMLAVALTACFACTRGEQAPRTSAAPAKKAQTTPAAVENPFRRPTVESQMPSCTTVTLDVRGESSLFGLSIENRCAYTVAVLTSPIEMRVRQTATEKFVHERMRWTAYALLHLVLSGSRSEAWRGDGVIRDGGLRVRRDPGYTTIPSGRIVNVPVHCALDVPPGRYALSLMTYEAPQGNALIKNDPFDCRNSVAEYNRGVERSAPVSLGGDVHEVQSNSVILELGAPK